MPAIAARRHSRDSIWPGFVDALATLLMVFVFLLLIFVIAQVYLNDALLGRDQALDRLRRQVNELADLLSLERSASADLRLNITQLSAELQTSIQARDSLEERVRALTSRESALLGERDALAEERNRLTEERQALIQERAALLAERNGLMSERDQLLGREGGMSARLADLEAKAAAQERRANSLSRELEDAYKVVQADREKIELQLAQIARLGNEVAALKALRADLEQEVGKLAANLKTETDARAGLDKLLAEERKVSETARAQMALLNQQVSALRSEIARLSAALDAFDKEAKEKDVQIASLGRRLNAALASRVQELSRYRSEFFGRLREVLGDRKDIQIVGDRFVFQSEVLFASASAELEPAGAEQIARLAETLNDLAGRIPKEIDWVLRVDGHTDRNPIATDRYPSNWELSTARAISVVKFLISRGIPSNRLAAAGFGEFQPIDPHGDEIAYRRNRRIELKLDQR
ncbi:MAG: peptidoglycan -binding protein [Proteobacteria bacterium]|nr:peptidoglycan -binding protein [Pseudomonadota bacterium]